MHKQQNSFKQAPSMKNFFDIRSVVSCQCLFCALGSFEKILLRLHTAICDKKKRNLFWTSNPLNNKQLFCKTFLRISYKNVFHRVFLKSNLISFRHPHQFNVFWLFRLLFMPCSLLLFFIVHCILWLRLMNSLNVNLSRNPRWTKVRIKTQCLKLKTQIYVLLSMTAKNYKTIAMDNNKNEKWSKFYQWT